jgi:Na+/H+-dicarboxylate symporter
MMRRFSKIGLLPRVLIAIVLGILLGLVMGEPLVRFFVTFNDLFGQLLGFLVPLIIIGLVTPAIGEIGSQARKLLLITVAIAYADTVFSGLLTYSTGQLLFPAMMGNTMAASLPEQAVALLPYFKLQIPQMVDVMSALILSFILGICIAYGQLPTLRAGALEFKEVVSRTISGLLIPLLPIYIFGLFLNMTFSGQVWQVISVFASIIMIILALHIFILLYEFVAAGIISRRNPIKLLWNMLPAYATALGTSSSAATIPVTLKQTQKNGVSEETAGFVIPICATIHMSGSVMKITACALAISMLNGMPTDLGLFLNFILMLSIMMIAAPGVPGGAVMAALAPLSSILGFSADQQAMMITIYIAMDSFGTACNVTGDGAIALIVDRWRKK